MASFRATLVVPLLRQVDEWLRRALVSALHQTVECEVIVVTSPDTPASNRQILSALSVRYPQLRMLEQEPGTRFPAAMNLGIRSATADRIGFLLTDDWLDANAVEVCLRFDSDIVSTAFSLYAADGKTPMRRLSPEYSRAEYERLSTLHEKAHYLGHFFLFRRTALEAVGGLDETLGDSPGIDDLDMVWCLLERGASVSIVEQALYNYRDHAGERLTNRRAADMMATFLRILDKHRITGAERERMVREHSPWFGRPLQDVYRELNPWPIRKLRETYRAAVPLVTRRRIQDRWIDPVLSLTGFRKP